MAIHQCPKCELRFERKTELDDHCWHDHPQFRHDYPAAAPDRAADTPDLVSHVAEPPPPEHHGAGRLVEWLVPRHRATPRPTRTHSPSEPVTDRPDET